jgi:acetoin utilization deacetylase AcuC-like enzyme
MPLPIVHHPDYDARFDANHRFPMGKYRYLMEELRGRGLASDGALHEPVPADADLLSLAHARDYVEQVIACQVPAAVEREIGFPVDERVSRRARLATAGTLMAARLALGKGLACNTAGGSHHARRGGGAGFCTFNDVAVATLALLQEGAVRRVLVVDLDVHQGDGTADILMNEARAFTFSMHAEKNYPVRKVPSDLDLALPDGIDDDAYIARLEQVLPLLEPYARPDLVFYNAGVDPHRDDKLGRLSLSNDGLRRRDTLVIETFRSRGIPVCGVIGGGYGPDAREIAKRHSILFETAAGFA